MAGCFCIAFLREWFYIDSQVNCSKEKDVDTIGFIGGGNMAEALIKGIVAGGILCAPECSGPRY